MDHINKHTDISIPLTRNMCTCTVSSLCNVSRQQNLSRCEHFLLSWLSRDNVCPMNRVILGVSVTCNPPCFAHYLDFSPSQESGTPVARVHQKVEHVAIAKYLSFHQTRFPEVKRQNQLNYPDYGSLRYAIRPIVE